MERDNMWKNIPDVDTCYKINKNGEIWSEKTNKMLTPHVNNGYYTITLGKGNNNTFLIHRLVAKTFINNDDEINNPYVDHINSNKLDNRVENLQWITQKGNLEKSNIDTSHPRKVLQLTLDGKVKINTFNSVTEAGVYHNVTRHAISKACLGINKSSCGYCWKFEDEKNNHNEIDISNAKSIYDYENYFVFEDGKIYNTSRKAFLKPCKNAAGYEYVTLCRNKMKKNHYIHKIVEEHF